MDRREAGAMKKTSTLIILLVFVVTGLFLFKDSFGKKEETAKLPQSETITIVDNLDNKVTVPKKIDRIAVAGIFPFPSILSVFLGSAEKIVGMPPASMSAAKAGLLAELFPEILKADTSFTSGEDLNIEELIKLKPDVVFYSSGNGEWTKMFAGAGISAVAISPRKWDYDVLETYDKWIELLSEMFPESAKAKQVSAYSKETYDKIQNRVKNLKESERKKVLFLFQYDDQKIVTSGKHFFGQYWCDAVGAKNAAEEITVDNANAKITMEQIYNWNPDVVFITNFTPAMPDDIYSGKIGGRSWNNVKAAKTGDVYKMPLGSYRSYTPGADTPVTLLWLAQKVYPELFKDINIEKEVKDYYSKLYGIELTEEQIKRMYSPGAKAAEGFKN